MVSRIYIKMKAKKNIQWHSVFVFLICSMMFILTNCNARKKSDSLDLPKEKRVSVDTEMPMNFLNEPDKFHVKNPEYNPSWFAKFTLTQKQRSELVKILEEKNLVEMRRSSSPTTSVSWWETRKGSSEYTYLTTYNAPVNVVISSNDKDEEVYIWWSSP